MYNSHYWFTTQEYFTNYPETRLTPLFKYYYLIEFSFWMQQILTLNLEAKRKDYYQMFGHHILTCILMVSSYMQHTTRIGHAILVTMDFADIFLPVFPQ